MPNNDPAGQAIEKTLDFEDQILAEGRDRIRGLGVGTMAFGELPRAFQRVVDEAAPNRTSGFKTIVESSMLELHPIIQESYAIGVGPSSMLLRALKALTSKWKSRMLLDRLGCGFGMMGRHRSCSRKERPLGPLGGSKEGATAPGSAGNWKCGVVGPMGPRLH